MKATILIVDDSPTVRQMARFALETRGYRVVEAQDGKDALLQLEEHKFDLVVLDIYMPGIDGLAFLDIVRNQRGMSDLPVLVLTTGGSQASQEQAMALGATGYMNKPSQPEDLLERVAQLLQDQAEPVSTDVVPPEAKAAAPARNILLVEDSPTQALQARLVLEDAGHRVRLATNGREGLDEAMRNLPDLIIADINMPVMDGYEMTRKLKANPDTAGVPVVMLTAKDQPIDVIRGLEAGGDHFITKPYDLDYLLSSIRMLLNWLEDPQAGQGVVRSELDRFDQDIIITKSREQILRSLLQATTRVTGCESMALLTQATDDHPTLFILSQNALSPHVQAQMREKMVDLVGRLGVEGLVPDAVQTVAVATNPERQQEDKDKNLMASFLQAPLLTDGETRGMVSIFGPVPFDVHHVRFVFEMGQQAAHALGRLRVE